MFPQINIYNKTIQTTNNSGNNTSNTTITIMIILMIFKGMRIQPWSTIEYRWLPGYLGTPQRKWYSHQPTILLTYKATAACLVARWACRSLVKYLVISCVYVCVCAKIQKHVVLSETTHISGRLSSCPPLNFDQIMGKLHLLLKTSIENTLCLYGSYTIGIGHFPQYVWCHVMKCRCMNVM